MLKESPLSLYIIVGDHLVYKRVARSDSELVDEDCGDEIYSDEHEKVINVDRLMFVDSNVVLLCLPELRDEFGNFALLKSGEVLRRSGDRWVVDELDDVLREDLGVEMDEQRIGDLLGGEGEEEESDDVEFIGQLTPVESSRDLVQQSHEHLRNHIVRSVRV